MSEKEVLAMQNKQCRRVSNVCGEDDGDSLCFTGDWEWQKQGWPCWWPNPWEWGGLCWFPEGSLSLEPVKQTIPCIKSPDHEQNYSNLWTVPCDQALCWQPAWLEPVSYPVGLGGVWPQHGRPFFSCPMLQLHPGFLVSYNSVYKLLLVMLFIFSLCPN